MGIDRTTLIVFIGNVADALGEMAPSPVTVSHADGVVTVVTPQFSQSLYIADNILDNLAEGASLADAIRGSVQCAITAFEDDVTRLLTVPWPDSTGAAVAHIVDGTLHLSFGEGYARSVAIPGSLLAEGRG